MSVLFEQEVLNIESLTIRKSKWRFRAYSFKCDLVVLPFMHYTIKCQPRTKASVIAQSDVKWWNKVQPHILGDPQKQASCLRGRLPRFCVLTKRVFAARTHIIISHWTGLNFLVSSWGTIVNTTKIQGRISERLHNPRSRARAPLWRFVIIASLRWKPWDWVNAAASYLIELIF